MFLDCLIVFSKCWSSQSQSCSVVRCSALSLKPRHRSIHCHICIPCNIFLLLTRHLPRFTFILQLNQYAYRTRHKSSSFLELASLAKTASLSSTRERRSPSFRISRRRSRVLQKKYFIKGRKSNAFCFARCSCKVRWEHSDTFA